MPATPSTKTPEPAAAPGAKRAAKPGTGGVGLTGHNRDRESIYRPGQLSKVFAPLAVLLVLGWVAMIWKDYDRPWRDYQRRYYDKVLQLGEAQLREAKQEVAALEAEIDAARRTDRALFEALQADPEYRALQAGLYELRRAEESADARVKQVKGVLAPARYVYETARTRWQQLAWAVEQGAGARERLPAARAALQAARAAGDEAARAAAEATVTALEERVAAADQAAPDVEDARRAMEAAAEPLDRLAEDLHKADRELRLKQSEHMRAKARIADLEKPWRAAVAKTEKGLEPLVTRRNKLEGEALKYRKNQWRNAPFVDFISPTIKIEQLVLDDIHDNFNIATNRKVDRCITCHRGISNPDMGDAELLARHGVELERYMRAHPGLELMAGPGSPHRPERFGCSTCHQGVGWATDFARAAHTPATAAQKAEWKAEHGWDKPKYVDYPMLPLEYTEGQCYKCHKQGVYYPPHYPERLDHGFFAVTTETRDGPLYQGQMRFGPEDERAASPANRPLGPWEVYGEYALPGAPVPVRGSMGEVAEARRAQLREHFGEVVGRVFVDEQGREDARALRAWLDAQVHDHRWRAERYERGHDTVVNYGCQGCHKIQDFGEQVGYAEPPRVGPDITYLADKVDAHFVEQWIKHPDAFRPDTRMPSFFYFVNKDANFEPLRDPATGKKQVIPVIDAHRLDPELWAALGPIFGEADEAYADVMIKAMATYLLNQRDPATGRPRTREGLPPDHPDHNPLYDREPPAGDRERGRELVNSLGCTACHMVPELKVLRDGQVAYEPDSMARFEHDPLLMRGPRLLGLGSKIKSRRWLDAWLADPRHYTATTRMPDMRIDDERDPATGRLLRSAEQRRADVVDYLLGFRDEEFDALEPVPFRKSYERIVVEMYEYFFGMDKKEGLLPIRRVGGDLGDLGDERRLGTALARVGERLMARAGCFGCHAVAGHEHDQPIGVELTTEGVKDLHQLDFGSVPKDVIPHSRHSFFRHKITTPRVFDWGKAKPWYDQLRMPRFNFRMDDPPPTASAEERATWPATRALVAGIVLGLVNDPILPGARHQPDEYERDILNGRKVVARYGCNNCHTIEGRAGFLWGLRTAENPTAADVPPNLFGQGLRTQSEWLLKFLKHPKRLRPIVNIHMPRFGLNDAEADALVRYFLRLAGREQSLFVPNPDSKLAGTEALYETGGEAGLTLTGPGGEAIGPVYSAVDEARLLFDTVKCNKCHLPPGTPGADPTDGGVAPSFEHAPERLRWTWVRALIHDPAHLIHATKMPKAYGTSRAGGRTVEKGYQPFTFHLRWDPRWQADWASEDEARRAAAEDELARVQMDALADYLIHHYVPPGPPAIGRDR